MLDRDINKIKHDKLQLLSEIILNYSVFKYSNTPEASALLEALDKYDMVEGEITTDNCNIFRDINLTQKLNEVRLHSVLGLRPLKTVTIAYRISRSLPFQDFDTIYRDVSTNIKNIAYFQEQFNVEVSIDIYLKKEFDAEKASAISGYILTNGINYLNFIFDFPALNKDSAYIIISNIKQFCLNPILTNTKMRLVNFPFCFIPPGKYKCLYRHRFDALKGRIHRCQEIIRNLKNKKFAYLSSCKKCRCRIPCYAYTDIQQFPAYAQFVFSKTQKTVVFVGGSLEENDYYTDEDIVYTSPAEQGDMFITALEGFENILIIDGYFYSRFPCTTFEVMLALENGINVFGSSSIGALRAVELDKYGMTGIGYVYEYLKKQPIKPYHIVAQTYDDHNVPLTTPLVDIIYFLESALSAGIINKKEFDNCLNVAEGIHFTALSFRYLFNQLSDDRKNTKDIVLRLEKYFLSQGEQFFNIKKKDALLLLTEFRNILADRERGYVRKTFNESREKYLSTLHSKYRSRYDLTLPNDWQASFSKRRKSYPSGNTRDTREYSAERTCELAKIFFHDLDIVIADTTKYDFAGAFIINIFFVPFYFLQHGLSCSTGNGDVFIEALAVAYMELIERIPLFEFKINSLKHDELCRKPFLYKDLPQYYNWDKGTRYKNRIFKDSGYIEATEILSGKNVYIPLFAAMSKASGTDGNASGNSLPEAILYGIYELIERDVMHIYVHNLACYNLQSTLLIDKRDIQDERCQAVLEQFESRGCKIILLNLLNTYNIPCICCNVYDSNHRILRHGSAAVRSDFQSAIYAALHEAYMQYIIYFSGTRDDYQSCFNTQMQVNYKEGERMFFNNRGFIKIVTSSHRFNSVREELRFVISKLTSSGISHIIVVNTSPTDEYGIKSVKVIIPKLELIAVQTPKPSPFIGKKVNSTIAAIKNTANC